VRQRRLLQGILDGKSARQSALTAGYAKSTANSSIYKPGALRVALSGLLDEAGLDDVHLAKRLRELTDATQVKVFNHEGKLLYSKPLVAHEPRAKGLDMAFRIKGHYPRPEDAEEDRRGGPVVAIQLTIVNKDGTGGDGKKRILDNIEFRTVNRSDRREGERQP